MAGSRWRRIRTGLPRISCEARWIWLAVFIFIATSVWWLTQDDRVPDYDSGYHMYLAALIHHELIAGQFVRPLTDFNLYPPLVHFVGALSIFAVGLHPMALILSSNIVFVPVLAFGCYGVGRIAYGPRAGVLAALLALGSPMIVSMMHEYDLDPPQAAMVAVSVWAILASRRFERIGMAAAAGALIGLAMLTKETSVVFLAGPLVVAIARGGWRNWRGIAVCFIVAWVVAEPWYVFHSGQLIGTFNSIGELAPNVVQAPPRFSARNLTWYGWDLVNEQVLAPFAVAFLIGAARAVWRLARRRVSLESVEPELLAGAVVSYAGMTALTHKDPRYTLPSLVYVAVLATGWIGTLSRARLRAVLSAAVVIVAAVYFAGLSAGTGDAVRIALPGSQSNIIYPRQFTVYETKGWVRGGPVHDADVQALLVGLRSLGIRWVVFKTGSDPIDFNLAGVRLIAMSEGLSWQGLSWGEQPHYAAGQRAQVILRSAGVLGPKACQTMNDGSRIYVVRAPAPGLDPTTLRDPAAPQRRYTLICPGRAPVQYP